MHIFCPNCGKHIDVSIKEIERLEGHYLCPQCLVDIDLEGFEQNTRDFDYQDYDNEETAQSQPAPSVKSVPEPETRPTATPPAYKAPEPAAPAPAPHKDDVIRYCKRCGAFLRQGVSYCPKCGNYVKVKPPTYRGTGSQATALPALCASRNPISVMPPALFTHQDNELDPPWQVKHANHHLARTTSIPASHLKESSACWGA